MIIINAVYLIINVIYLTINAVYLTINAVYLTINTGYYVYIIQELVDPDVDWMIQEGHTRLVASRAVNKPPVSLFQEPIVKNCESLYKDERKERMRKEIAAVIDINPDDTQLNKLTRRKLFEISHPTHEAALPIKRAKKKQETKN